MVCEETWVFSKHDRIPLGESDYLDPMRSKERPTVMGHDGLWIWSTPSDYMKGGDRLPRELNFKPTPDLE